jgi:hypothetical protein
MWNNDIPEIKLEVSLENDEPFYDVVDIKDGDTTVQCILDGGVDDVFLSLDTNVNVKIFEREHIRNFEDLFSLIKKKKIHTVAGDQDEVDALIQTFTEDPISVADFFGELNLEDLGDIARHTLFAKFKKEKIMTLQEVVDYYEE